MCANPACRQIITLELHHISWVKEGGGNSPENLLALCRNCHGLHTIGKIPQAAIAVWKSILVSLNAVDRMGVDHLLYLAKLSEEPGQGYRYTVDTMLLLARLFNADLIERGGGAHGGGALQYSSAFQIDLTERGRRLVTAWRVGDPRGVSSALGANADRSGTRT